MATTAFIEPFVTLLLALLVLVLGWLIVRGLIRRWREHRASHAGQFEVYPPSEAAIARRALCLGALLLRARLEQTFLKATEPAVKTVQVRLIEELRKWLRNEDLEDFQSRDEQWLFAQPAGSWEPDMLVEVGWRAEALGVLLWALGEPATLPAHGERFDVATLLHELPLLRPTVDYLIAARARPPEQIERARQTAEQWLWRSRAERMLREESAPAESPLPRLIQRAAQKGFRAGLLPRPVRHDFAVGGRPYRDLSAGDLEQLTALTRNRHLALSWLHGDLEEWDESETS